jgi:multidrug resistance efflux pump
MGKYGAGMKFIEISELQKGAQFFMFRPTHSIKIFIAVIICILSIAAAWSLFAKMDDVIKADAFIRPNSAISLLKTTAGGEVIYKNYSHNGIATAGDLLLQIDVSSDVIELGNTKKLLERTNNTIEVYETLRNTISGNANAALPGQGEAYLRSEIYLTEKRKLSEQIRTLEIALERERGKPEALIVRNSIEDAERQVGQAALQLSLWDSSQMAAAIDALKAALQSREDAERRIAELERAIRSAAVRAPISGRINEIRRLNIGDRVLAGEEIASIIPEGGEGLKAELYIDASYIARVKEGQKVSLRFPGLPPSKFGKLDAVINLIPADYTIMNNFNPVFIVEARIDRPWLAASDGEIIYLKAGIGAEGRIIIDRDTVFSMVLKKLDFIN